MNAEEQFDRVGARRWDRLTVGRIIDRPGLELHKPAVVFEGAMRTYGELRARARRVANALLDSGIEPLDRVAVLSSNRLEYLEIEAGISLARGIMVPLNWRLKAAELRMLLNRAEVRRLIVEDRFVDVVREVMADGAVPSLRDVVVLGGPIDGYLGYDDWCASSHESEIEGEGTLDDPHEIIFTSGTTGRPKGAIWTNGTLIFNSLQQVVDYQLGPDDSCYVQIDLYYIGGRHDFTWPLLHVGGTVHVKRSSGFDAEAVVRYVSEHRITQVLWVPAMLFDILRLDDLASRDLSALRMIMCGGAPVPREFIEQAQRDIPSAAFVQVYGLTEGGGTVTFLPRQYAVAKLGSAGRPSLHNEIRIADPDGRPLPAGEPGEILVRGPAVTAGYWGEPDLTAAAVRNGWLHTGDQGKLDEDGFLFVTGRIKDMIISGGMNIFPDEIESVLMLHPAVLAAAVIGVPHPKWGESVRAVVQLAPDATADESGLIDWCESHLGSYKKPTSVVFVEEMPRTASGKIQKFVLRDGQARA